MQPKVILSTLKNPS